MYIQQYTFYQQKVETSELLKLSEVSMCCLKKIFLDLIH